jgi:hypothetical protein
MNKVRVNVVVGVVALVAFAALSWFLVLGPRLSTASNLASETEQAEFANTTMLGRYNQTLQQADTATKAASDAQALFATMPQQAELPEVLRQIIDAAGRAGIDGKQIAVINSSVPRSLTGDPATGADPESAAGAAAKGLGVDLAQLDLDITVSGNRPTLLRFLDELQALDRAVLVSSTGLTSLDAAGASASATAGKGAQSLDVTASMFVLQSKLPDIVAAVQKVITDAGVPTSVPAVAGGA